MAATVVADEPCGAVSSVDPTRVHQIFRVLIPNSALSAPLHRLRRYVSADTQNWGQLDYLDWVGFPPFSIRCLHM
jgi:hypothetical protein